MTTKIASHNSDNSAEELGIYKTAEYELMLRLIEKGLWRTRNLARAVGVDEDTMTKWKRTKQAQKAYSEAVLKFIGRRKDVEKILSELDVESNPDPNTLNQFNIYAQLNDEQLKQLITTKARQLGIVGGDSGNGAETETEPTQLPETTP